MKLTTVVAFFALITLGYANSVAERRFKRQIFGDVDPSKVPSMLNNPSFVEAQHRCLVASESDATRVCDRIGKKLREHLGPAIRKADCPVACTQKEKETIVEVIDTIQAKYPKYWEDIVRIYAVTPEQITKLNAWTQSIKKSKA